MIKFKIQAWLRPTQAVITIFLLILLGRSIKWPEFFHLIIHSHWELVLESGILLLLCHMINVARWQYLLQQTCLPYSKLASFYGIGLFSNNFLPTGIGGDGVRAILASRYVSWTAAIVSVGLDRIIGLSTLGAVFILGLWLGLPMGVKIEKVSDLYQTWRVPIWVILLISLAGFLILVGFIGVRRLVFKTFKFMADLSNPANFPRLKRSHWVKLLSGAYGISIVAQALHIGAYWVILEALGIQVPLSASIWLVLFGSTIILLPISINGLGVQESAYVLVLTAYKVDTTLSIGFALTVRILLTLFSLAGGLFLIGSNLNISKKKESLHIKEC